VNTAAVVVPLATCILFSAHKSEPLECARSTCPRPWPYIRVGRMSTKHQSARWPHFDSGGNQELVDHAYLRAVMKSPKLRFPQHQRSRIGHLCRNSNPINRILADSSCIDLNRAWSSIHAAGNVALPVSDSKTPGCRGLKVPRRSPARSAARSFLRSPGFPEITPRQSTSSARRRQSFSRLSLLDEAAQLGVQ